MSEEDEDDIKASATTFMKWKDDGESDEAARKAAESVGYDRYHSLEGRLKRWIAGGWNKFYTWICGIVALVGTAIAAGTSERIMSALKVLTGGE